MTAALLLDCNGVFMDDEPQHCDADVAWLDFVHHSPANLRRLHA